MHHVLSMTKEYNKNAIDLAHASKTLIWKFREFREAQHRVMFQLTNPSLSFPYEFKSSGEDMERARVELSEAINEVEKMANHTIFEGSELKAKAEKVIKKKLENNA